MQLYLQNYDVTDNLILAIEKPVCRKWAGSDISETAIWTGVFKASFCGRVELITRSKIRWHIVGEKKANDKMVRASLIERIHPEYNIHKNPGPLEGIVEDIWQALAVAVTCYDLIKKGEL